ncbi:hypothetical protein [Yoonia sp.]|uniref:hypothetical protein n=1 Tax=Yoonia sp. TaxID=2212373 RepID=UPI003918CD6A
MTKAPLIRIAPERKTQLEELAAAFGTKSMSATIGELMRIAREAGEIKHAIPGVRINKLQDGFTISFDDSTPVGFTVDQMKSLVGLIHLVVYNNDQTGRVADRAKKFTVTRQGAAFKVAIPADGIVKIWTADIALDFADLMESEISDATPA